ncbi:hypothetical protein ATK36_0386 [Amycolatopsis sulphurea]|uniref:Bifunctional DNA primase/polymerase-like protein n=1 Tax=Amycolatopsis sulphurea TaxID=76022 RepID=A0A2A9FZK1_9PSEU|nr:hypothetical protein [Amycolatopsis sulphurea]PFG56854.1 hypothetical protein ATK36_0386 [Amycolatopsis sulphurea]
MTLDQQLWPGAGTGPATGAEPAAAYYGGLFGWTIRRQESKLFLALEGGLCAVTLPKLTAGPVLAHLLALGCEGPSVVVPTPHGPRLSILAETDGQLLPRGSLPADVTVLDCGALLPLPAGQRTPGAGPEWLTAPDPRHRWLPSVSAVLAGVRRRP